MINCRTSIEHWAMTEPFEIAREVITDLPVLMLGLADEQGHAGRAEAAGVDYDGETPHSMAGQIAGVLDHLHDDMSGADLMRLLPAGGARNALDCALWDLRAKQTGVPAWRQAGLTGLKPVITAYTIGLGDESTTRRKLRDARHYPLLKLKVDAQRHVEIVRMARQEHPQARLMVDANQAWSRALLLELLPELAALGVELVEQRCRYVDLDGPLLQQLDRATPMHFHDGLIEPPSAALWG